jgi:hypothetical protein
MSRLTQYAVRIVDTEDKVFYVHVTPGGKIWEARVVHTIKHCATPGTYHLHRYPIRNKKMHQEDAWVESAISCAIRYLVRHAAPLPGRDLVGEIRLDQRVEEWIGDDHLYRDRALNTETQQ